MKHLHARCALRWNAELQHTQEGGGGGAITLSVFPQGLSKNFTHC